MRARPTPLVLFYGLSAAAGAVVPWYFNLRFLAASGEWLTPHGLVAAGFANP